VSDTGREVGQLVITATPGRVHLAFHIGEAEPLCISMDDPAHVAAVTNELAHSGADAFGKPRFISILNADHAQRWGGIAGRAVEDC
jgi:hypothetical protein